MTGVTIDYAMATLGINVTESAITFEGTTYRDADSNTTIVVKVNGQTVNPTEYVFKKGDHVHIVVKQS